MATVAQLPSRLTSVSLISIAEEMNPSFRRTMEDTYAVLDGFGGDRDTGFFGVYDGHGGRAVSEYLRTHLHDAVEKELEVKGLRTVEECLKAAFLLTDIECSKTGEYAAGSTAVVCIVRRVHHKRYVYTANCGDARAVLCHNGRAVRLSRVRRSFDPKSLNRLR